MSADKKYFLFTMNITSFRRRSKATWYIVWARHVGRGGWQGGTRAPGVEMSRYPPRVGVLATPMEQLYRCANEINKGHKVLDLLIYSVNKSFKFSVPKELLKRLSIELHGFNHLLIYALRIELHSSQSARLNDFVIPIV